jgi:hypothetical protein
MSNAFLIGFSFALAEQFIRAVVSQSISFRPRKLMAALALESGPFLCFSLLSGVGAHFLTDSSSNHTFHFLLWGFAWISALLLRNVVRENLWWLSRALLSQKYAIWEFSCLLLPAISLWVPAIGFLEWHQDLRVPREPAWKVTSWIVVVHTGVTLIYVAYRREWMLEACSEYIDSVVRIYCKRSPDNGPFVFENPRAYTNQRGAYYAEKLFVAYSEKCAAQGVLVVEETLVDSVAQVHKVSKAELTRLVREKATRVARELDLEWRVLVVIAGIDHTSSYRSAYDIVSKSDVAGSMDEFLRLRSVVSQDRELVDTDKL